MIDQLDMFTRRRLPPPPEFAVHCLIADTCKLYISPRWEYTHIAHGEVNKYGKRYSPSGQRLQRMGLRPGWPDFQFAGPHRSMFFLELKRRGRGLTEDQARIAAHIVACGFPFLCTSDPDDAIQTLIDLGILRAEACAVLKEKRQ